MKKIIVWTVAAVLTVAVVAIAGHEWSDPGVEQMTARMIREGISSDLMKEVLALDNDCDAPAMDGATTRWNDPEYTYLAVREYHDGEPDKKFCFVETVIYDQRRNK